MSRSGMMLVVGTVAAASVFAATGAGARELDVERRISAQAAIESVYWSHRIWPAGNDGPKPALQEVLPERALRATVENYLLQSKALEQIWGRPIQDAELQAEIERMVASSRAPGVLQELFAALGNDPILVAECLARPILADRLMRSAYASDARLHQELKTAIEQSLSRRPTLAELRRGGQYAEAIWVRGGKGQVPDRRRAGARVIPMSDETWQRSLSRLGDLPVGSLTSLQEDDERFFVQAILERNDARLEVATVAWSKKPFDEWWAGTSPDIASASAHGATVTGGVPLDALPAIAATACTSDTWAAVQTSGAPTPRQAFSGVWTGTEMIVWGGYNGTLNLDTNTGGRYNPATNSWAATPTTGAPVLRDSHSAVWTGTKMVIWGGGDEAFAPKDSGGRYDPATNTWQATTTTGGPTARLFHTAVWSGARMIVWGGWNGTNRDFDTGGLYDPAADAWTATSRTGAPTARDLHTAVWSGTRMIVWGGEDDVPIAQNTGARFDPVANSWTAMSLTDVPAGRWMHSVVWTGTRMIVWGGFDGATNLNTGALYDPAANTWIATSTTGAPAARDLHAAVWADAVSEMIVWGGQDDTPVSLSTGGRYNPATGVWTATSTVGPPASGRYGAAVWTGSEMIVWGGWNETAGADMDLNTGGRYCDGACAAPPPGGSSTISVSTGGDLVSWSAVAGADAYDLVRGSLTLLNSSGGNFTTSLQACLANDQAGVGFVDGALPQVGSGFWYLVRGVSCGGAGTYDSVGGNQVGSRDAEVAASPGSCP